MPANPDFNSLHQKLIDHSKYISFQSQDHLYFNKNGQQYASISQILQTFLSNFDKHQVSKNLAQRQNKSQQEIQALWDVQRDFSSVKGTEFHLYVETFLKEGRSIDPITPIQPEIQAFHSFWDNRNELKYDVVSLEQILANDEKKIAGTIDCLAFHYKSKKLFLFDWKTNRLIREKSYFNRKLKPPLQNLDDCELVRYSLKMKLYKWMLQKIDVHIHGEFLIHFLPHPEKFNGKSYKIINCLPLEQEALSMLESYQKINKNNSTT